MTDDERKDALKTAAKRGKMVIAAGNVLSIEYTTDELEFLKAMDAYKRDYGRPNPTVCEVLAVLKTLGYTKTAAPL